LVLTKTKAYLGRPLKLESGCKQMRDHVDLCELIVAFNLGKEYGKDNNFDIVTQSAYERIYNEYYENRILYFLESSPHTDKKRRWRAKKKDQHHRTQVSLRRLLNASHQYSSGINENFMFFRVKN
ncbi:unnamed protein product, partial [Rotaria magnacalcarata]